MSEPTSKQEYSDAIAALDTFIRELREGLTDGSSSSSDAWKKLHSAADAFQRANKKGDGEAAANAVGKMLETIRTVKRGGTEYDGWRDLTQLMGRQQQLEIRAKKLFPPDTSDNTASPGDQPARASSALATPLNLRRADQVRRLDRAGWTGPAIAVELGCTSRTIRRYLKWLRGLSLEQMKIDVDRDLRSDLEAFDDTGRRLDAAISELETDPTLSSTQIYQLKARGALCIARIRQLTAKNVLLVDVGARRMADPDVLDQKTLRHAGNLTDAQLLAERKELLSGIVGGVLGADVKSED